MIVGHIRKVFQSYSELVQAFQPLTQLYLQSSDIFWAKLH